MTMMQPMQLLTSHASAEWYTPPAIIERVRAVLGEIDLDPASNETAQEWIKANCFFTEAQNGLGIPWYGKVWLNPPYGVRNGRSQMDVWSRKLEEEYAAGRVTEAILLVNSTHGYAWYERLWIKYPCCLVTERIRFVREDGTTGDQAKRGQTFLYLGRHALAFAREFEKIGRIVWPERED